MAGIPRLAQDPTSKVKLVSKKAGSIQVGGDHRIDVLCVAPGLDFEEAYRTAVLYETKDAVIPILNRQLLIAHKRAVGEPKDLDDVKLLMD